MESNAIKLAEAQIEMLILSDADIRSGNVILHEQLNENDLKLLNDFLDEQTR